MESILKFFAALLVLLTSCTTKAQGWTQLDNLPAQPFTAFEVIDGKIYAASGNSLYTSTNGGETWSETDFTNQPDAFIYSFKKFGSRIFAGTTKGVFSAPANNVSALWNHDINTLPINGFSEKDNVLYAAVEGFGVMRYNGVFWMGMNAGLPTYSYNVEKIIATPNGLFAMAGANGTFYRYDFAQGQWIEDYFSDEGLLPGLMTQDVLMLNGVLYMSTYNKLLRSDDLGDNWSADQTGLPSGQWRFMHAGHQNMYAITTDGDDITKLNKRPLDAPAGTAWNNDSEVLPWFTFAMAEHDGKIFMAALDGVYVYDTTMGNGGHALKNTTLYPNPSADGRFTLQTDAFIDEITVHDLSGRTLLADKAIDNGYTFTINTPGLFIVNATKGQTTQSYKIAVK